MNLSCAEIGISGCTFSTRGDEGEALDHMLDHLRSRHGYDIAPDEVSEGGYEHLEEPERMIAARLHRRIEDGVAA